MKKYFLSAAFVFMCSFFISASCEAVSHVVNGGLSVNWNDSSVNANAFFSGGVNFTEPAIANITIAEISGSRNFTVSCGGSTGCNFGRDLPLTPDMHNTQWQIVQVVLHSQIDGVVNGANNVGSPVLLQDNTPPSATLIDRYPRNIVNISEDEQLIGVEVDVVDYGTGGSITNAFLQLDSGARINPQSITKLQDIEGGGKYIIGFPVSQSDVIDHGDVSITYRSALVNLTNNDFTSFDFVPIEIDYLRLDQDPVYNNQGPITIGMRTSEYGTYNYTIGAVQLHVPSGDVIDAVSLDVIPSENGGLYEYSFAIPEDLEDQSGISSLEVNFAVEGQGDFTFEDVDAVEFIIDRDAPVIVEVTPIPSVTSDNTPSYTFDLSEDAEITVAGEGCVVAENPMQVSAGNHTITFSELNDGLYEYCEIWAEDNFGNRGVHSIPDFRVDINPNDEDITKPNLVDLTLSTTSIDTTSEDQEVVVTFTATDDLSGICIDEDDCEYLTSLFFEDDYDRDYYVSNLEEVGENQYAGTVTFPQNAASGDYDFTLVLRDRVGNSKVFDSREEGGVIWEDGNIILFDDTEFIVTNAPNLLEDVMVPIIIEDPVVDPSIIDASDGPQTVTVTFTAADDISGVCVKSESPNCDTRVYFGRILIDDVERISGTATTGTYRAEFVIPQYSGVNELEITIEDRVGNEANEYEYDLSDDIFENATDPVDVGRPQVFGDFSVNPSEIDTSKESQKVKVRFTATDDLSGVCEGKGVGCTSRVSLKNSMSQSYYGYTKRISGDKMNGVYEAEVILPRYTRLGSYNLYYTLEDNVGNDDEGAEDFELEDAVENFVGASNDGGDDKGDGNNGGADPDDKEEINIPRPDLSLSGKMKDLVLSSKKKIYIKRDEIKFKGEFKELAGGMVKIKYKRGSKSETEEVSIDENGEWSEKVEFNKDGSYKIKFTFYDKDGKEVGSKGYYKVKIDTEDPVIADMPARLTKRVGDKLWWEATDDEGIDKYKYILNGKKTKTKDPFFHIPAGTPPGVYDIEIRAYDDAGNKDVRNVLVTVQ